MTQPPPEQESSDNLGTGFQFSPPKDPSGTGSGVRSGTGSGTGSRSGTGSEAGNKGRPVGVNPTKLRPQDLIGQELDTDFDSIDSVKKLDAADSEQREKRLPCSFPGLMKILVPEKSFVPTSLAVRVANLSATGAMVEVHDGSKLDKELALANRFFELKVAHPEIPTMRGVVAWSDLNRDNPLIGLSSFEEIPGLHEIVLTNEATTPIKSPPQLPPPRLDPIAPTTTNRIITIVGEAPEALSIVAKGDKQKFSADVLKGKFELKIELSREGENHFSIRSFAGQRKSRAVPIRVVFEAEGSAKKLRRRGKFFDLKHEVDDEEGRSFIEIEFRGNVEQAERILYRFSRLMSMSEHVTIIGSLDSPGNFDQQLLKGLKSEGSSVMGDTAQRHSAERILDEIL